ncbi:MAG: tripartite tricarboxylate transporter TctB family protein [Clostridiales bacterium]|nr:tripartite tricarboxylate transporter TctB family protein [Clostridiales bacterium]
MKKEKGFNYNLLSCIFMYVMSGAFLISSFTIEDRASRTFPQVICALCIFLTTLFLIQIIRGKYTNTDINLSGTGRAIMMAGIILLYILGINFTGYYIASFIFLPAAMLVLGQRNWKVIVGVDVGVVLFIYLFFGMLLSMQMPEGILF